MHPTAKKKMATHNVVDAKAPSECLLLTAFKRASLLAKPPLVCAQISVVSSFSSISFTGIWIANTGITGSTAGKTMASNARFPIGVGRMPATTS